MAKAENMLKALKAFSVSAGLSVLLGGCGPLISFGDDGPADTIYTLRYEGGYPGSDTDGPLIYVEEPHFADDLDGRNVAVLLDGDKRSVIDGVAWSSPLAELVRNYITRALGDGLGANIVSEGALDINATCRVGSKVWALEYVPGAAVADDKVVAVLELSLVRFRDSALVGHTTLQRRISPQGSGDVAVMEAFSGAMAGLADDMRAWFLDAKDACRVGAVAGSPKG